MVNNIKKIQFSKPLTIERRRFIRHPITFPLEYEIFDEKSKETTTKKTHTSTINISQGGLMFSSKKHVNIETLITIKMPFQEKIFRVKAKVVHCDRSPETKLYNIGVCFLRFNDAFKVKLIEQIYLISEYRDLRSVQIGKEITLQEASKEWIKHYSERFKKLYW